MVIEPDRRRRDLDNLAKTPLDALVKAGAMADDSQIDYLSIQRGVPAADGYLLVLLTPTDGQYARSNPAKIHD